jgi:hypothetical protein
MEEFLAYVLVRAACLLAGALIGRLIRAFLARPGHRAHAAPVGLAQGRRAATVPGAR